MRFGVGWTRVLLVVVVAALFGLALPGGVLAAFPDADSRGVAATAAKRLKLTEVLAPWQTLALQSGPAISRVDITGKFLSKKHDRWFYRSKAIVRRAGGDRKGNAVLLEAPTWDAAFRKIDQRFVKAFGTSPGFIRQTMIKTGGYSNKDLRRPFPTLKAKYEYRLELHIDGPGRDGFNAVKSRRQKGVSAFVEPIAFGLPPGTHRIGLNTCWWPSKHPITTPLLNAIKAADQLKDAYTALTGGGLLIKRLAKIMAGNLFKGFALNSATCTRPGYELEVLAEVPKLKGKSEKAARKALRRWGLKLEVGEPTIVQQTSCDDADEKASFQDPAPKQLVSKGSTVTVAFTFCLERADDTSPWQGTWDTNFQTMYLKQTGSSVSGCYAHDAGKIGGFISGDKLTGNWTEAPTRVGPNDAGNFAFSLVGGGGAFEGPWTYASGTTGSPEWTGTRTGDYPVPDPCSKSPYTD